MESLSFIASRAEVLVERGDLSIVRMHTPAGDQPPLHVHAYESETFYMLEGSVTVWVGDQDPITLGPGDSATAPPGLPHTYRVGDEDAVFLVTTSPGRFASFVRAVAAGEPEPGRLARIAADHDITILGPPGLLPSELAAVPA